MGQLIEPQEDFIDPFVKDEIVFNDLADIRIEDGLFSCALVRRRDGCPAVVVQRIIMTPSAVIHCANKAIRAVTKRMLGLH